MIWPMLANVVARFGCRSLPAAAILAFLYTPAFATQNYQTDIDPTPRDGRNSAMVKGHGMAKATLNGGTFSVEGAFTGLAEAATTAHLCIGNVMGGTGPCIYDLTVTTAKSGEIAGTFTLTPDQVRALNDGRIYVLLDSQTAPKGNLWGWFQPAHVTVGPDVPQEGEWYIPNFLAEKGARPS